MSIIAQLFCFKIGKKETKDDKKSYYIKEIPQKENFLFSQSP